MKKTISSDASNAMRSLLALPTAALITTSSERIRDYERYLEEAEGSGPASDSARNFHRFFWRTAGRLSDAYTEITGSQRRDDASFRNFFLELASETFSVCEAFRDSVILEKEPGLPGDLVREWLRNAVSELCLWAEASTCLNCGNHPLLYTPRLEMVLIPGSSHATIRIAAGRDDGTVQVFDGVSGVGDSSEATSVVVLPLDSYSLPDPVTVTGAEPVKIVCHLIGRIFDYRAEGDSDEGSMRLYRPVETPESVFGIA